MASKRAAAKQLTHDNWNDEEEPEEAGEFQQASADEIKTRTIKKAKRRGQTSSDENSSSGAFKGFSGFGSTLTPKAPPTFAFNKTNTSAAPFAPSTSGKLPLFGSPPSNNKEENRTDDTKTSNTKVTSDDQQSKFLSSLKALNTEMLKWLQSHMDKNPYCYFSPVFSDYSKYLEELKAKYPQSTETNSAIKKAEELTENSKSTPEAVTTTKNGVSDNKSPFKLMSSAPVGGFKFGSTEKAKPEIASKNPAGENQTEEAASSKPVGFSFASQTKAGSFNFGPKPSGDKLFGSDSTKKDATTSGSTGFSFGKSTSSPSKTGLFSFGSSSTAASQPLQFGKPAENNAGFSFKTSTAGAATGGFSFKDAIAGTKTSSNTEQTDSKADEEEYEPPKPEVTNQVSEDDALYTRRVKLFYQLDGQYKDKGIGNLFVKPLDSGKKGLLIRADTNLGNVLLNISLNDKMPIAKVGKNNVNLVCIPNPPMYKGNDGQVTTLLLKVKTEEDADELCEKLNEFKK